MTTAVRQSPKHVVADTTEWIEIAQLNFDPRVNRDVKQWQVDRIVADFDLDALGVIDVSLRVNGDMIVLAGQHRVLAVRKLGFNHGQKIECRVHTGLTVAREAKLAMLFNKTRKSSHADDFIHRIVAEDAEAVAINNIVVGVGLHVSEHGTTSGVSATVALERVYRGVGFRSNAANPTVLHDTLRTILAAWGKGAAGLQGSMIEGVGGVLLRYDGQVDNQRLSAKLGAVSGGPTKLIETARHWREAHGGTISRCCSAVLIDTYNHGSRTGKLAPWFSGE